MDHEHIMAEKQYALCEDGYIRCCNCEAKQSEPHAEDCTGGSLLQPVNREGWGGAV